MRVVIDTTAHPGGGAMTYLDRLLTRFVGGDDEYIVIVPGGREALTRHEADNIRLVTTRFPVGNAALRELYRQLVLPLVLLRLDADVLHSTGDITSLFAPVPTVVTVHNLAPYAGDFGFEVGRFRRIRNRIHRWMTRLSVRRATRVIWVSRFMSEHVGGRFDVPESKGAVIHHGVDAERFREPSPPCDSDLGEVIGHHEPYVLTVATVNPHKNLETLIEGLSRYPVEHDETLTLLIAGRHPDAAYLDRLRTLVRDRGLEDRVSFLGGVPREHVPWLYTRAELYVLPSLLESFGLTPLEAMASGIPVIAADATAVPEICGDAAAYFDPYDPADLARAMADLLDDAERRQQLVAAGERRIESFDWDETARQTEALLRGAAEA